MTITDYSVTKRKRISVYVDGEFLFAVEQAAWIKSGLYKGCETDEEQLNELLRESRELEAKRRAFNMLSARSYTAKKLSERLAEKSGREAAQAVVQRMEELGLVNDEDYAVRYARDLYELRGFSKRRISFELKKRGISDELCQNALEQLDFDNDEQRAVEVIARKFHRLDSEADIRRASALLERYGYGYSQIRFAINALREGDNFDEE